MTVDERRAQVRELAAQGFSNREMARRFGVDEKAIRRDRVALGLPPAPPVGGAPRDAAPVAPGDDVTLDDAGSSLERASMDFDIGKGEGEFRGVISTKALHDWAHVFEFFELDPEEFEIVDDTIKASVWNQSARSKNGDRDVVKLRSYKARFRKVSADAKVDLPALYASVQSAERLPRPSVSPTSYRNTFVVWADPQVGKVASRGGTRELIERSTEKRALIAAELTRRAPKRCVLLDGGDGVEGFNSGGNPMFTNDLSLTRQLDLYGTELMEWIKVLMPHGPVDVLGVPSNHAAWRNGKQNLGNPGDDFGLFMHRQVAKLTDAAGLDVTFHESAEYDESAAIEVDGTVVGLTHGHQFPPGGAVAWWEKQTFGSQAVTRADILVTAHYHSFGAGVAGRNPLTKRQRWWLGAPTLDNGSDWYRNTAGRDSDPGVMLFDVTEQGFDLGSLAIL